MKNGISIEKFFKKIKEYTQLIKKHIYQIISTIRIIYYLTLYPLAIGFLRVNIIFVLIDISFYLLFLIR
jgi:hypothetical protein